MPWGVSSSSAAPPVHQQHNPEPCSPDAMAFQRVDPTPFILLGLHWDDVPNRVQTMRAISTRAPARNEDVAIVSINPMPLDDVHFGNIREIVRDFLVDERDIRTKDIQPCLIGQAFVPFYHVYDRDNLILTGPLQFGNVSLSFCKHNDGSNFKALNFNRVVWLLLLNFLLDHHDQEYIRDAISPFAKLVSWVDEPNRLVSVIVQARVVDLESIPHFIPYAIGDGFLGNSWTIQAEIIRHQILGGLPADEDQPPSLGHFGPNLPFDHFGFGQHGPGPQPRAQCCWSELWSKSWSSL